MKWKRITVKTITSAEDVIISMLYDIGLEGAQIEDKVPLTAEDKERMFIDIMPEMPEDDGIAYLSFFVEEDETTDLNHIVEQVKEVLDELRDFMEIGEGSIRISETEDKDWINNWKQFFHQFSIEDLLVVPSWEEPIHPELYRKLLRIDPGTAFGTGMHATTQLCIRQILQYVTPQTKILDIGCGSGILGIIALMYGADSAYGTDLDSCAIEASLENMKVNGIDQKKFPVVIGNIITDEEVRDMAGYEKYDIVAANILAEVLLDLTPQAVKHLKKGGIYITSGIIEGKEDLVKNAVIKVGLEVLDCTRQGEWFCVTARK